MQKLEEQARAEYDAWVERFRFSPPPPKELVALGIEDGDEYVWFEMENVAYAASRGDGRGEFLVEGPEIMRVCIAAAEQLGYLRLGQDVRARVDAMLRERVVVIWHTHTATVEPSREDIDEFPEWLADAGMVYHVPSNTTTVYNKSGVISSTNVPLSGTLATSKE